MRSEFLLPQPLHRVPPGDALGGGEESGAARALEEVVGEPRRELDALAPRRVAEAERARVEEEAALAGRQQAGRAGVRAVLRVAEEGVAGELGVDADLCLLYTSPSPRDA